MYNGLNLSGGTTRLTNVLEFIDEMKEITYMVGLLVFFSFLLTIFVTSNNMFNFLNTERGKLSHILLSHTDYVLLDHDRLARSESCQRLMSLYSARRKSS